MKKIITFILSTLIFLMTANIIFAQQPPTASTGCVSGKCFNGKGEYIYASGDVYEGDFVNGKKEGQGKYTHKSGSIYIGQFADNKKEGQGTYTFKNGDQYVGEFSGDKFNGSGIYYYKTSNTSKKGLWKDNIFVGSSSAVSISTNKQTAGTSGESELDKLAREWGIVITPEQKRENARKAKEMADAIIKNPENTAKVNDTLKNLRTLPKEFYEMVELRFRQQAISKKFDEFDAAYRKPLSDRQRLEMLNQIIPEYQKALKETEALEKPTFNFSAEEKLKIAENKTYYTKVLDILNGMKAAMQPPASQTGGFSQAEVDEFNKQNPNVGKERVQLEEVKVTDLEAQNKLLKLYAERGMAYLKSGKFDEAMQDAERALEISPKNAEALLVRGLAKGGKKDFDGAITDFSQVIKISPNRAAAAYFRRGEMYEKKGDFSKAIADYNKAAELDPKAVDAATKARLRTEARINAAQSGTTVGGALTKMTTEMEAKKAELLKLNQYQQKLLALQNEADPLVKKLVATRADDSENQRINRAALLPKAQAIRNYLVSAISELTEYKSPEGQEMRETFLGVFKSINGLIAKLY